MSSPRISGPTSGSKGSTTGWFFIPVASLLILCAILELHPRGWLLCLVEGACLNAVILQTLLDMIPALIVMGILAFLAADFVRGVYGLKSRSEGWEFVQRRLSGEVPLMSYLVVKEAHISLPVRRYRREYEAHESHPGSDFPAGGFKAPDEDLLVRVGGPGGLIIYDDSAVVLEQAGKLGRVLTEGSTTLDAFEKVRDVVDLRPKRRVCDLIAMSREGIPVKCKAEVLFQVGAGLQKTGGNGPYQGLEQAIFLAAMHKRMCGGEDQKPDWIPTAVSRITENALRDILATYSLDQFLGSADSGKEHCQVEILDKLKKELNNSLPKFGVRATRVELSNVTVADSAIQHRIEAWRDFWRRWARGRRLESEAEQLQFMKAAEAQAKADMIVAALQLFQSSKDPKTVFSLQLVIDTLEVLKRAYLDLQADMLSWLPEGVGTWNAGASPASSLGRKASATSRADETTDFTIEKKSLVRLHIDQEVESFGEAEQRELIKFIAHHTETSEQEIELIATTSDSPPMTLQMPEEAALKLVKLYLERDPVIGELGISNIGIHPTPLT